MQFITHLHVLGLEKLRLGIFKKQLTLGITKTLSVSMIQHIN